MENYRENRTYYYARVSAKSQNLDRQINLFVSMGGVPDETIIIDKVSGKDFAREGYNYLKKCLLRYGDTLVIKELDRLGRNKTSIKEELQYFAKNGIRVKITDLPTTMTEIQVGQDWILQMINNILIEVLSNIAEQELLNIKARQKEGIAAMPVINGKKYSSRSGNPVGRPPYTYPPEWSQYYTKWKNGEITAAKFMRDLNIKRTTFYNLVKKMEKTKRG
jgi:DNA invertase Pin-like site-specific DNA recombinase